MPQFICLRHHMVSHEDNYFKSCQLIINFYNSRETQKVKLLDVEFDLWFQLSKLSELNLFYILNILV